MKKFLTQRNKYSDNRTLSADLSKGKESAFDFLFRTRYNQLCNYAFCMIRDACAAEDLIQDIFSAIWQNKFRMGGMANVDAYMRTAVRNKCLDWIKHVRQESLCAVDVTHLADNDESEISWEPETSSKRFIVLEYNIQKLPSRCKQVFELVAFDGLKYREAADRLDLSLNTVKSQMKIAYKALRGNNLPPPPPPAK